MKGCRVIEFDALDALPDKLIVPVWSRIKLCGMFDLSSNSRLIEWCLLAGNEYTERFFAADFGKKFLKACPTRSLNDVLRFVRGRSVEIPAGSSELNKTLQYCCALYELADVTSFEVPKYRSICADGEQDGQYVGMMLGKQCKDSLAEWMRATLPEECGATIDASMLAVQFMEFDMANNADFIKPSHLTAIRTMLSVLGKGYAASAVPPIVWENVCVANHYQMVVEEVAKFTSQVVNVSAADFARFIPLTSACCSEPQPSRLFNPLLFHSLVHDGVMQQFESTRAASPQDEMSEEESADEQQEVKKESKAGVKQEDEEPAAPSFWDALEIDGEDASILLESVDVFTTTLHIDAVGFLSHICERNPSCAIGCYGKLGEALEEELRRLSRFHLVFFFEGTQWYHQADITRQAAKRNEVEWEHFRQVTRNDKRKKKHNIEVGRLPIPPLSRLLLLHILQGRFPIVHCNGRVDQAMALASIGSSCGRELCYSNNRYAKLIITCIQSDN